MADDPMWKMFGNNAVCSIRRCGNKPTKRVDLAVVGTRKYEAFGKPGPWREGVGGLNIAVCDDCAEAMHGNDATKPGSLHVHHEGLFDHLKVFVILSLEWMKEAMVHDGSKGYGVLEDIAGRECEQQGECGKTKPYCLPCRARSAIDKGVLHGKP